MGNRGRNIPLKTFFPISDDMALKNAWLREKPKNRLKMTQKNELKNQLLTRKKVNVFQDKTQESA
jgi:hypothetical protein